MSSTKRTPSVRIAVDTCEEEQGEDLSLVYRNRRASERAQRAATTRHRNRKGSNGSPLTGHPHPATGDPEYSGVECAYLKAIGEFQASTGRRFPTHAEYLAIATRVLAEQAETIAA